MDASTVPILLAVLAALALAAGLLALGLALGPSRAGRVKEMPYESGMDPIHGARRRFDVRFHLVAIAFLVFDVELLFLYPWAVAAKRGIDGADLLGVDAAVADGLVSGRGLVFAEVMVFIGLLALGWFYVWRKGLFTWR